MRIRLSILAVLVALFGVLGMAPSNGAGGTSGCYTTPDPVVLNQPWSVTAFGMTPNAVYWGNVTQAKDASNGGHPNLVITTDATGTGTTYLPSTSWAPDAILAVGDFKIRVYPYRDPYPGYVPGEGTVNCAGTVVAS